MYESKFGLLAKTQGCPISFFDANFAKSGFFSLIGIKNFVWLFLAPECKLAIIFREKLRDHRQILNESFF